MSIVIDPARDALVLVDVQNDFCRGGSLAVPDGDDVVPVLNRYAKRFGARGAPVFATRDWHPSRTRHFTAWGGSWPPHCVAGTPGAAFHPGFELPPATEIVSKGMDPDEDAYSAFQARGGSDRPFSTLLRDRGIGRLFVGGLATDYCVKATVLDARGQGFDVLVLEDAVRAVDVTPGDGKRALEEMIGAGAGVVRLADLAD